MKTYSKTVNDPRLIFDQIAAGAYSMDKLGKYEQEHTNRSSE
jgi:hypothetical protein